LREPVRVAQFAQIVCQRGGIFCDNVEDDGQDRGVP
jgi:hypothetical protein